MRSRFIRQQGSACGPAGAAGRLPALADKVPPYIDCVTVVADTDETGRTNAQKLITALREAGISTELVVPSSARAAA